MSSTVALIVFVISIIVLIRSGSTIVSRLSRIAHFLQLSEFVVSFAFIALATSLPELFIGISSALHERPELSFANIVGANIINLTVAVGIIAIVARGLEVRGTIIRRGALYASFAAFLPILLLLDGVLSRVDGVILLLFLVWYFIKLFYQRERFTKVFTNTNNNLFRAGQFLKDFAILILAAFFLIASAEALIRSTLFIASGFQISLPILGLLVVAASTTLPEIAFGARAILMGHKDMALGNLIGSVIINSGLVIGITAVIAPIEVPSFQPYLVGILFTVLAALAFSLFTYTNRKISLTEGGGLIALYAAFVFITLRI